MKTGLLLQTPPRAQWLQLLSLPGNSRGLACLEVPDVQLFLFLQEGGALLEDPCISSGPEARLLPGLSADSLAWGRMSPPGGTCVFGLFANMKKRQVQSSQRVPQLLSQGDNQVFLWHRTVAGRSSNEERKTWLATPAPPWQQWENPSGPHQGLLHTRDLCSKALAGRLLLQGH